MPKGIARNGKRKKRCDAGKSRGGHLAANKMADAVEFIKQQQFQAPVVIETDEQVALRISQRQLILKIMAEATIKGQNKSLIVSGPPGLGKSYTVNEAVAKLERDGYKTTAIHGYVRPTGLYKVLYENREKNQVIVFDDTDSVFMDDVCLNLLKVACDTTRKRTISWLTETRMETEFGERVPRNFEFEGSVIFITNYDFDTLMSRGHRLTPHFEALISRSHYLDLSLKTKQDYLVRIKQVVSGGMLNDMLEDHEQMQILDYITDKCDTLRELSLRMVLKLANLMKIKKDTWKVIAGATCMKTNVV